MTQCDFGIVLAQHRTVGCIFWVFKDWYSKCEIELKAKYDLRVAMKEILQKNNHQGSVSGVLATKERRKYPRYKMNEEILSISEGVLAEAVDISGSGISCKCLANDEKLLTEIHTIELLNCELGTSVIELQCRLVRCNKIVVSPASATTMLNFSLKFQKIGQNKRVQLLQFIKDGAMNTVQRNAKSLFNILPKME